VFNLYIHERRIEDVTVLDLKIEYEIPLFDISNNEYDAIASFNRKVIKSGEAVSVFI
jgi:hypothetical protein